MEEMVRMLCKAQGMLEGEIQLSPMGNEHESDEVKKLIRANQHINNAISEIVTHGSLNDGKEWYCDECAKALNISQVFRVIGEGLCTEER